MFDEKIILIFRFFNKLYSIHSYGLYTNGDITDNWRNFPAVSSINSCTLGPILSLVLNSKERKDTLQYSREKIFIFILINYYFIATAFLPLLVVQLID